MKKLAVVVAIACLAPACRTARAQAPTTSPPLEVPPAPPRVIEPPAPRELPHPDPVEDLPAPPQPSPSRPRPNTPRDAPPRDPQKPEPKPSDTPAAEQAPPPSQGPPPTVPPLRTAATPDGARAERQIRDSIGRANTILNGVDYGRLSNERKKAYDDAKRFIEAAETAIKGGNFEYARKLANTALTLARGLQGR